MKKAIALLIATCLIFSAFAEDVAIKLEEFSGSADINWSYNLEDRTFGFTNTPEANLKASFFSEKSKSTEGNGIWGELKIETAENKIPYEVDDPNDSTKKIKKYDIQVPAVSVKTADIHLVDDDLKVTLGLLHGLEWESIQLPTALKPDAIGAKQRSAKDLDAGFKFNIESKLFDLFIRFEDNSLQKAADKKYGFSAETKIKPTKNIDLGGGIAYSKDKLSIKASLNSAFDLTDKLYLKGTIGYASGEKEVTTGVFKDTSIIGVGALFGWGKKEVSQSLTELVGQPDYALIDNDNKANEGVAVNVFLQTEGSDKSWKEILISAYDGSLVPGLTVGAVYDMYLTDDATMFNNLGLAMHYTKEIGLFNFDADLTWLNSINSVSSDVEDNTFGYGCSISTSKVVQNTNLYVKYTDGKTDIGPKKDTKSNKGKISVGAKISF